MLETVPAPQEGAESASERTVLAALAHAIVLFAIKQGLDPDDLCTRCGFHISDLADRDRQIPYAWLLALARAVEPRVSEAKLELEVARYAVVEQFGYLGLTVKHAATPLEALQTLVRHARLFDSQLLLQHVALECDGDAVQVVFPIGRSHARCWLETVLAGGVAILRAIGGEAVRPREVRLPLGATRLDPRVAEYLGALVTFDGTDCRVVFDRSELERPSVHADEAAAKFFGAQVEKLVDQLDQPFVVLVSRAIAVQLTRGDLSQRRIGRHLALSPRSLQRKLHQHGLKYTTLVEDTRKAVAARLLMDPARSISDVASELGYRDASSFTRVFKRWTGLNPRCYRDRQRSAIAC
jgi:AraC-like DNA-binding protein